MAQEAENGQERTEDPTPKRRREAREKGQVPRSRELNTTVVMVAAAAAMLTLGGYMAQGVMDLMNWSFAATREAVFDANTPIRWLEHGIQSGLMVVAPFLVLMFLASLISPALLGGWTFSGEAMAPKLEKINPLKGLKRIFGPKGLMELVKSLIKVVVVGGVTVLLFYHYQDRFVRLASEPLQTGIVDGAALFFWSFFALSTALILIAAVDVPFQLWDHSQKLKMTMQEIKDEYKETEGKPEVKGRIRRLQQEMAQGRMMEKVPEADVVVTNPTHFAVALKYDQLHMRAPQVVAKGTELTAARIRELASENKVPLFESPLLARALYHTVELEQEVPAGLYLAVAQVLAYVYQLRAASRGEKPARPDPRIPEEFMKYAKR